MFYLRAAAGAQQINSIIAPVVKRGRAGDPAAIGGSSLPLRHDPRDHGQITAVAAEPALHPVFGPPEQIGLSYVVV